MLSLGHSSKEPEFVDSLKLKNKEDTSSSSRQKASGYQVEEIGGSNRRKGSTITEIKDKNEIKPYYNNRYSPKEENLLGAFDKDEHQESGSLKYQQNQKKFGLMNKTPITQWALKKATSIEKQEEILPTQHRRNQYPNYFDISPKEKPGTNNVQNSIPRIAGEARSGKREVSIVE